MTVPGPKQVVAVEDSIEDIELRLLLDAIFQKYRYDFRTYSPASLKRRLRLACERFECLSLSHLQHRVLHEDDFLSELLRYLTVQVSDMFRDPHYFLALRHNILPLLREHAALKVWVAGCSTGEELYSLAILFREEGLEERTLFYGTDINREALRKAELGRYDMQRVAHFTENHRDSGGRCSLSDYYTAAYGSAVFDKSLRRRIVFCDHSLASDAAFGDMQLISCRNVLIYFGRELQDRAIGVFRSSLCRDGFLGLGSRESLRFSAHADAFKVFDRTEKIYRKCVDV